MEDPDYDPHMWPEPSVNAPFVSHVDTSVILRREFLAEFDHPCALNANHTVSARGSLLDVLDGIAGILADVGGVPTMTRPVTDMYLRLTAGSDIMALVLVDYRNHSAGQSLTEARPARYRVELVGTRAAVLRAGDLIRAHFGDGRVPLVSWWFKSSRGLDCRQVIMEQPKPVYDAFYPFIGEPVEPFIDRYMASSAPILFMTGDPGTGKTSLIRHMLYSRLLNSMITYDETLMKQDDLFISFVTDEAYDVMVVEDADTMLGSRESEGNRMISRLLNVSDGLIKISQKKMVFTTNLSDFSRVDPALTRPGRCFGAIHFRPLTAEEARAAAEASGMPEPEGGEMTTLAELFNNDRSRLPAQRKVGF